MDLFQSSTFGRHVEAIMKQHRVPGFAIAIAHGNKTASAGYGYAVLGGEPDGEDGLDGSDHRDDKKEKKKGRRKKTLEGSGEHEPEGRIPFTPDTLFDFASCSKSLTAAAVALLVEDEAHPDVRWDAVVSRLLPEDFVLGQKEYTDAVTVDDMLSHRTGLPRHDVSYLGTRAEKPDDARSITRSFRHLEIAAPLRTRYMYNNMMFTAAVHLVEVKTRQPFADFMQQRIFGPLEMNSTVVQPSAAQARGMGDRLSRGYYWESKKRATRNADLQARLKTRGRPSSSTTDETPSQEPEGKSKPQQGGKFHGFPMMDCPEGVGAGSIISSANDFIRWVRALMEHGGSHRIKDDKLTSNPINESIYRGLTRLRTITSPNPSAKKLKPYTSPRFYAAGLEAHWYRGALIIGHDGSIEGFSSRFFFLPEYHFGAVMFGNEDRADAVASVLQWELVDEVLGIPVEERGKERKRKNRKVEKEVEESEGEGHESSDAEDTSNSEDKGKGDTTTSGTQEINEEEGSDARPFPARLPLEAYTGTFSNAGYHTLAVQIDDNGLLFVEATDRSFGFTLTFEENAEGNHVLAAKDVRDGDGQGIVKHFTAHMKYWQNGIYESMPAAFLCRRSESWDDKTKAGFQAVRMGIKFEDELSGLIWFDRI